MAQCRTEITDRINAGKQKVDKLTRTMDFVNEGGENRPSAD